MRERLSKENNHPPAASDCLICHKPHASSEDRLLVQPVQQLCSQCHDVMDDAFRKDHINIDPSVINCRVCHDPHASQDPKFFKPNVHPPFASRDCEECHIVKK